MYDQNFYNMINEGSRRSARKIIPLLGFEPKTVVDVGCGQGAWLGEFAKLGSECYGIDGEVAGTGFPSSIGTFQRVDLQSAEHLYLPGVFDLAICLEVAEHLPESRAEWLIEELCGLSPVILFSAAIPGQGGVGHLHEMWPDYWAEKFWNQNYSVSDSLRWRVWEDDEVEPWYQQNLLLCVQNDVKEQFEGLPWGRPLRVVHPLVFATNHR